MEKTCDCHLHPDQAPLCSPIRGGFCCDGTYRMPEIPKNCAVRKHIETEMANGSIMTNAIAGDGPRRGVFKL